MKIDSGGPPLTQWELIFPSSGPLLADCCQLVPVANLTRGWCQKKEGKGGEKREAAQSATLAAPALHGNVRVLCLTKMENIVS